MKIGVLALQGDFREHIRILRKLGIEALEVRLPAELKGLDGLIIPGGESTTMNKMMRAYGFPEEIKKFSRKGSPVFGTCAGLIVLAGKIDGRKSGQLNLIDVEVKRNAYGRQVDSREADVTLDFAATEPYRAVFIRAPQIRKTGPGVKSLARYEGRTVLARQKNILICSFHPELTEDPRIHQYFVDMIGKKA
ncbi:MAG TPA: pyridoxal 5'-phosphate synthase glutaminase subunit PdxT [Syntrophales bacterium]|nr:pyridoxal 5'-phosphate synthase glutaminase subunit PdxT [Syntrophales bacterium]HOX93460.1 pyridoxal 5'-phosphate synthase glutaminase subunit PdxT [Syntrophales bacterium]HPI57571.1 pyridoxal 5'-phosphate synthase glutaminase subunit PdxT [Syntrophales bacterium]HPN24728.1 pyridoxal 5'-phosphate synthase glutaminase subunit PdxT [Syntrophales bacterium]